MKRYSVFQIITLAILRTALAFWFYFKGGLFTSIPGWNVQFSSIIAFSMGIVLLHVRFRKSALGFFFIVLDALLITLAVYPLPNRVFLLYLMFTHCWVVSYTLKGKVLAIYGAVLIIVSQLLGGRALIAGIMMPGLAAEARLFQAGGQILLFILCAYANRIGIRSDRALDLRELYERNLSNLLETNLDLQNYAIREKRNARESERKRIAGELHDSLMHNLLNLRMAGESMKDYIRDEDGELKKLLSLSDGILNDIWENIEREIYEIREKREEEKEGLNRINNLVRTFQDATQISVQIEYGNFPWTLGSRRDRIIYRVIQEGLTNAFRHGKADSILIILWQEQQDYRLVVRDNGTGLKKGEHGNGMGLWGIRERVNSVKGSVEFNSGNLGFEISVTIPKEA